MNKLRTAWARTRFVWVLSLGGFALSAYAQEPPYQYLASGGVLAAAERLEDVPEPFRAAYQSARYEQNRAPRLGNAQNAPPAAQDAAGRLARDRAVWRERMRATRRTLLAQLVLLSQADADVACAQQNRLLAMTPTGRARILAAEKQRESALTQLRETETLLCATLPAEARKSQIPPLWLTP